MADNNNNPEESTKYVSFEKQLILPIAEQIAATLQLDDEAASKVLNLFDVAKKFKHLGEYCLPIPSLRKFASNMGDEELGSKISQNIRATEFIEQTRIQGSYLYLKLHRENFIKSILSEVFQQREAYGTTKQGTGKTIVIEYSSPNIAKPFHAGHLRSTIIGNFLKNIHQVLAYHVVSVNYLGDWGKQYGLLAVGYSKYGNHDELTKNPIQHLYDIYVKINQEKENNKDLDQQARDYFKKMEQGDEEALVLWKNFRDLSITQYEKMYQRLNVQFDSYEGESVAAKGVQQQLAILREKGLLKEDQGASVVDLSSHNMPSPIIIKKDGTTLYLTRDLATAYTRWETYHFEKMYYVVACQQDLHFQQLFKILEQCGYEWSNRCKHINFGIVQGMSTRKGTAVFLQDILDESQATMFEVMQKNQSKFQEIENPSETADTIGLSAVFVQDFNAKRIKNYEMNWSRMTSFEGNTGPYLQYAHARLCSIQRKVLGEDLTIVPKLHVNYALLQQEESFQLVLEISKYPSIVQRAFVQLEPVILVTYLYELAGAISVVHEKLRVLGSVQPVVEARMLLLWVARTVLGNGIRILGLQPLEKM